MDNTMLMLGKILGEVYRIQKRMPDFPCHVTDQTIYGLLHGFESDIEEQFNQTHSITEVDFNNVCNVLDEYWPAKTTLTGFYDIERKLSDLGIDRGKAILIMRYMKLNHQFTDQIKIIESSSSSPVELRNLDIAKDRL